MYFAEPLFTALISSPLMQVTLRQEGLIGKYKSQRASPIRNSDTGDGGSAAFEIAVTSEEDGTPRLALPADSSEQDGKPCCNKFLCNVVLPS